MAEAHPNARLETFGDGVFAIALTLLEGRIPSVAIHDNPRLTLIPHFSVSIPCKSFQGAT